MPPKLYLFHGSPGVRAVMITAKALDIRLEHHELDYTKGDHLGPEFIKLNPQHTAPTLDDKGIVIWDSHAIIAYLVGKYAKNDTLYPKDLYRRALIDQRLHFDSGILYPLLRTIDLAFLKKEITEVPPRLVEEVKSAYDFLEKFLEARHWATGDSVTIADFSLVPTVTSLDYHVKLDQKAHLHVIAWIKRAQSLPCFVGDQQELKHFKSYFENL
ncbi:hypothetical protein ILUMI_04825 [Ignelater luminosus]|uniref:Glutathione S-transferase n=1 Tax=Ignelater luminosus TaxID=2038154 RepID=A0A8K0DD49_IGNLU|nr:hypothetical protein ILUMI_04825 [Ignelater luminosus]